MLKGLPLSLPRLLLLEILIVNTIALTVAGIVINSVSIALSALTSLDWQSTARKDRKFAQQLVTVTHVHDGSQVLLTADQKLA